MATPYQKAIAQSPAGINRVGPHLLPRSPQRASLHPGGERRNPYIYTGEVTERGRLQKLCLGGWGWRQPHSHQGNKHAGGLLWHYKDVDDLVARKELSDDHRTTARADLAARVHDHG